MSGIVGILSFDGAPIDRALLWRMTDYLAYCGPDRRDVWVGGSVGFGHTLLSTTFESAREQQPCSLDGQTWITADARVDDRATLIGHLAGQGRAVTTETTDVELILHAYSVWGEACLDYLIGDFAFAIWDAPKQRLFCVRDHFGVSPFYYAEVPNGLVFSNALNALRLHPAVSDRLNEQAIGDFLLFNMNMDVARTTFADIRCLPPAHVLTVEQGAVHIRRYWTLPQEGDYLRYKRPEEYVERFTTLFDQAIGDRLRTDKAGTNLSGGMDSSSIAVTAQKILKERGGSFDLRAYTIVYEWLVEEEEGRYADLIAGQAGIPIEHIAAEPYALQAPDANPAWMFPEPLWIANQHAEGEIARRVASFGRVSFTGFGGDPLFSYNPGGATGQLAWGGWRDMKRDLWWTLSRFRRLPRLGLRTLRRQRRGQPPTLPDLPTWINPAFARRIHLQERWAQLLTERQFLPGLQKMGAPLWVNFFQWGHPGFHGFPLKTLFPFFDLRLVSYLLRVPPLPFREKKRLLREAMRGRLPEVVRERPKTVLYAAPRSGVPDLNNPGYKLAQREDRRRWQRQLISASDVSAYVHIERLLALVDAPVPLAAASTESCFILAYWLKYQHRPVAAANDKELNHAPNH